MEAHHLAKYKRMNFNSLIPESEERQKFLGGGGN